MANATSMLATKEAELAEVEAKGRPLAIALVVLTVITVLSTVSAATRGAAVGVHFVTAPILVLLVFLRLPHQLRAAGLAKEIRALNDDT